MNISSTNSQRPDPSQMMQNFFSKVDADGSGGISESEWQTAMKNRPGRSGATDGADGTSSTSTDDASSSSSTRAADTFKAMDTDGDGEVSETELQAYAQTHHPDGPPPSGGAGGAGAGGASGADNSTASGVSSFDGSTQLMNRLLKALDAEDGTSSSSSGSSSTGSVSHGSRHHGVQGGGGSGSSDSSSTSSSASSVTSGSGDATQQLIQELIAKLQQKNTEYSANGTTAASTGTVSLFNTSA